MAMAKAAAEKDLLECALNAQKALAKADADTAAAEKAAAYRAAAAAAAAAHRAAAIATSSAAEKVAGVK
eukprot:8599421-Heterocapsa_arctica.AAC.1